MNARELEAAEHELTRRRKHQHEAAGVSAALLVLALVTLFFAPSLSVPLAIGGTVGALVAITSGLARQDRIACLALDPLAHSLPEVAQYATRLTSRLECQRLASWLAEILHDAEVPGNWYLVHRVHRYAEDLSALSRDLADPRAEVRPASMAACHLLLTQAVDSPLYNPAIPDDLLPAIIARIRLGISFSSV